MSVSSKQLKSMSKTSPNDVLFSLQNYNFSYQQQSLFKDISFVIRNTEKVAIVGPSGVGKTSLLNVLFQQQADTTAYCTQHLELINNLNAYNNIYTGRLTEFSTWQNIINLISINKLQWQHISKIAQQLAIEKQLKKSVNQLSGGQQQRVAIARALYQNKAIFFGDEPVSNLDPSLANTVLNLLVSQHDCCVVSLHDRHLALSHFDRIIGLKDQHIVIDQPSNTLQLSDLDPLYINE